MDDKRNLGQYESSEKRFLRLQTRFKKNFKKVKDSAWTQDNVALRRAALLLLKERRFNEYDQIFLTAIISQNESKEWKLNLERGIMEVWSYAQAMRLPVSKEDETAVIKTLAKLRSDVSRSERDPEASQINQTPDTKKHELKMNEGFQSEQQLQPVLQTDDVQRGREIIDEVNTVLDRARKLSLKLKKQNKHVDDECIVLVKYLVLAMRSAKMHLKGTYVQIPWDEMEFFLVAFYESHTNPNTWSFLVATVSRTYRYLKLFIKRVEEYSKQCDVKNLEEMRNYPNNNRATFVANNVKEEWLSLYEDCASLRDLQSLLAIEMALGEAIDAIQIDDSEYDQTKWLVLRRALFVTGEKMKNTWVSPNLSERYQQDMVHLAPHGVAKILTSIRDGFAHGKRGSLQRLQKEIPTRKLKEELRAVRGAVMVLIIDAEWELLLKFYDRKTMTEKEISRVNMCIFDFKDTEEEIPVYADLLSALDDILSKGGSEELLRFSYSLRNDIVELSTLQLKYAERRETYILGTNREKSLSVSYRSRHVDYQRFLRNAFKDLPWSRGTLGAFKMYASYCRNDVLSELNLEIEVETVQEDFEYAVNALNMLSTSETCADVSAPVIIEACLQVVGGYWYPDATEKILRGEQEREILHQPILDLFCPILYGKRLRNFLNHKDHFIDVCCAPNLELRVLGRDLNHALEQAIVPPLRRKNDCDEENNRLLKLISLKCEMFQYAEKGDWQKLCLAVEKGVDMASRDIYLRSLLHVVAESGHIQMLRSLLPYLCAKSRDWEGHTALHFASNVDVAKELVRAGISVHSKNFYGRTPLHIAASRGLLPVVQFFLDQKASSSAVDNSQLTPMHLAAAEGHVDVVKALLQVGGRDTAASKKLIVSAVSGGKTIVENLLCDLAGSDIQNSYVEACKIAAQTGQYPVLECLLKELKRNQILEDDLQDVALSAVQGGFKNVITYFFSEFCSKEETQRLIKSKVIEDLNLLQVAAKVGSSEAVNCLLDEGADLLENFDSDKTALHLAVGWGYPETAAILLGSIPPGHRLRTGELIMPPLCLAAMKGHEAVVKLLIAEGAYVNEPPKWDKTWSAVHFAAEFGHVQVLKCLLESGAKSYDLKVNTFTPLHAAAYNGHLPAVQLLFPPLPNKDPAKVDMQECRKRLDWLECVDRCGPVLHCAISSRSISLVRYLLEQERLLLKVLQPVKRKHIINDKVSVYQKNRSGDTCLQIAIDSGLPSADIKLLLEMMSDKVMLDGAGMELKTVFNMVQTAHIQAKIESGDREILKKYGLVALADTDPSRIKVYAESALILENWLVKLKAKKGGKTRLREMTQKQVRATIKKHIRRKRKAKRVNSAKIKSDSRRGETLSGTLWRRYTTVWYNDRLSMDRTYKHFCL